MWYKDEAEIKRTLIEFYEYGLVIEKWKDTYPVTVYISVPEHSRKFTEDGYEIASKILINKFREVMLEADTEPIIFSRVRYCEIWTDEMGVAARDKIMKEMGLL